MAEAPNKLSPDVPLPDTIALINDNFDKTIQNIGDLGAKSTNIALVTFGSVAAGASFNNVVHMVNQNATYSGPIVSATSNISGVSALTAAADVYVDNDNNANYLYPLGSSLTSPLLNVLFSITQSYTTPQGTLATIVISGRNKDSSAHTYYFHLRASYFPAIPTTVFR